MSTITLDNQRNATVPRAGTRASRVATRRGTRTRRARRWTAQHTGRTILVGLAALAWTTGTLWAVELWAVVTFAIIIHEGGHAIVGARVGYVTHVRVGCGPLLWRGRVRGRIWDIRLVPLFGFTSMSEWVAVDQDRQEALTRNSTRKVLADIATAAAGPAVNLIVGFVALTIALGLSPSGPIPARTPQAGAALTAQATVITMAAPFTPLITGATRLATALTPLPSPTTGHLSNHHAPTDDASPPRSSFDETLDTLLFETHYHEVPAWQQASLNLFLMLGLINVSLGAVNLVPGVPLDGYWILRHINDLALPTRRHLRQRISLSLTIIGVILSIVLFWQMLAAFASW